MRTWARVAVVGLLLAQLAGCTLLHDLQPHRLRRLNRVPPPSLDPEFMSGQQARPGIPLAARQPARVVPASGRVVGL